MIKKITLFVALCAASFAGQAQYNFNLEDWNNDTSVVNWGAQLNEFADLLGDTSVVRTNGSGASGFGAKLKPVDLSIIGLPYLSFLDYGANGGGVAFTGSFDSVYFDAINQGQGQTLELLVTVTTTNLNGDTIKYGEAYMDTDYAAYTTFGIQMDFHPGMSGMQADSMFISVLNGMSDNSAGTAFSKVDNFRLANATGSTGLADLTKDGIKVYPTLAKETMTVDLANTTANKFVAISMDGKVVAEQTLNNNMNTVNISNLENGSYLYQVVDANNVVSTGKFIVRK